MNLIDPFHIDTRSRVDRVREGILNLIREGYLAPGECLSTQRELANKFRVSLSSIREAVQSLIALGALESARDRRVNVRELSIGDLARKMYGNLDTIVLTRERSLQLLEARAMIEVRSAQLAALRRTEGDLQAMVEANERSRTAIEADDLDSLIEADMAFHSAVVAAAQNDVVSMMCASIVDVLRNDRLESYKQKQCPGGLVVAHQSIYEAIRDKNPEKAARLVEEHLDVIRRQVERRDQTGRAPFNH